MYPYKQVKKYFIGMNIVCSFILSLITSVFILIDKGMNFEIYDFFKTIGLSFLYLFFIPSMIGTIAVILFKFNNTLRNKTILFSLTFFSPVLTIWMTTCGFRSVDGCFIGISIVYVLYIIPFCINSALQGYWLKKIFPNLSGS